MALFDAFSRRTNTQTTTTTNVADSYNQTFSSNNVVSDQGNLALNLGDAFAPAGGPGADPFSRILPILAIGLVGIGVVALLRNR